MYSDHPKTQGPNFMVSTTRDRKTTTGEEIHLQNENNQRQGMFGWSRPLEKGAVLWGSPK